jgi:hypothetical protein
MMAEIAFSMNAAISSISSFGKGVDKQFCMISNELSLNLQVAFQRDKGGFYEKL